MYFYGFITCFFLAQKNIPLSGWTLVYLSITYWRASWLPPSSSNREWSCCRYSCTGFCGAVSFQITRVHTEDGWLYGKTVFPSVKTAQLSSTVAALFCFPVSREGELMCHIFRIPRPLRWELTPPLSLLSLYLSLYTPYGCLTWQRLLLPSVHQPVLPRGFFISFGAYSEFYHSNFPGAKGLSSLL